MPVFGQMLRFGRHVVLGEDDTVEGLARCEELLGKGITIAIFPEGTRGEGNELLPFSRGAFELALRTNRPLLPVVIRGTADALPKGSSFCKKKVSYFHMAVQEPVPVPAQPSPAARRRLATDVRQKMERAFYRPRPHLLAEELFHRYRSSGPMAAGFARGKVSWDPVFWALLERLPEAGELLDVGCGEGLLGLYLRLGGKKLKILGVDHDATRIERAQRAAVGLDDLDFRVGDARSVEGSFDVITLIDVLHYLPTEVQGALLARLVAMLRPGGHLYLRDPEPGRGLAGWWTRTSERVFVAMGRHKGEGVTVQGSVAISERLRALGLEELRVEDCSGGGFANMLVSGQKSLKEG
jgi:2-polyprenyl-3-methyl-5-hydroxy-6-metoxy-1,4-benzoquinol methylase